MYASRLISTEEGRKLIPVELKVSYWRLALDGVWALKVPKSTGSLRPFSGVFGVYVQSPVSICESCHNTLYPELIS